MSIIQSIAIGSALLGFIGLVALTDKRILDPFDRYSEENTIGYLALVFVVSLCFALALSGAIISIVYFSMGGKWL